jgi:hypothetical protein
LSVTGWPDHVFCRWIFTKLFFLCYATNDKLTLWNLMQRSPETQIKQIHGFIASNPCMVSCTCNFPLLPNGSVICLVNPNLGCCSSFVLQPRSLRPLCSSLSKPISGNFRFRKRSFRLQCIFFGLLIRCMHAAARDYWPGLPRD